MYSDVRQWERIRERILVRGDSCRSVAASVGMSRNTVRKMVRYELPPGYRCSSPRNARSLGVYLGVLQELLAQNAIKPPAEQLTARQLFEVLQEQGYRGSCHAVRYHFEGSRRTRYPGTWGTVQRIIRSLSERDAARFLSSLFDESGPDSPSDIAKRGLGKLGALQDPPSRSMEARQHWMEWLYQVERRELVAMPDDRLEQRRTLMKMLLPTSQTQRQRALVILAADAGFSANQIAEFLAVTRNSVRKYLKDFRGGGPPSLFNRKVRARKTDDANLRGAVFALLHEPPSASDINRTTWKMTDLRRVLAERGYPACANTIRTIIRDAGYRWRAARVVLTSTDPAYREKLGHIQEILANLQGDERFFSIDEFGPFAVKMKGGRLLAASGTQPTVPQWQKSKGCLILTASLELSTNQVTHFYSKAKNTDEMIRMAKALTEEYKDVRRLYLSWDAASWHISKKLAAFIEEHNQTAANLHLPLVELAPLPASAQFLNVIESVFSGMARAIIHNSDYPSADAAMAAIDRHFAERNRHYQDNPKRAGKELWGMERTTSKFSADNNCKDPAYR
jgi:transposase